MSTYLKVTDRKVEVCVVEDKKWLIRQAEDISGRVDTTETVYKQGSQMGQQVPGSWNCSMDRCRFRQAVLAASWVSVCLVVDWAV